MRYLLLGITFIVVFGSCSRNKSWVCTSKHVDGNTSTDIVSSATRSQIKSFEVELKYSPDVVSANCEIK